MEHFFPEPQNLLSQHRQIVYFVSKSKLPQEFLKLVDSGDMAPGFNLAIFEDFLKKTHGRTLVLKKSVEKSRKFFSWDNRGNEIAPRWKNQTEKN